MEVLNAKPVSLIITNLTLNLELTIETRQGYLLVAIFTFISFLSGLCCIGGLQMFVEAAFKEKEEDNMNESVSVRKHSS